VALLEQSMSDEQFEKFMKNLFPENMDQPEIKELLLPSFPFYLGFLFHEIEKLYH
jgi:hypothetical protein